MGSARERLLKEGKEQIRLVKEADVIVLYGKTVLELLARVMLAAFDAKSPIITFDKKYYADTTIPDSYRNVCVIFCGIRHSTREDMKKSALHIFGGAIQCIDIFPMYYVYIDECCKRGCDMDIFAETIVAARNDDVLKNIDCINCSFCNLNCKECTNGMQYRNNKKFVPVDTQIESLKRITDMIPIGHCNIQGGEPFLDRNLSDELVRIARNPRIAFITLATNGTMLPPIPTLETIRQTGCIIRISNYGELSVKKEKLMRLAESNGIPCDDYERAVEWLSYGDFKPHGRTEDENRILSKKCFFGTKDMMLYDGKLYCCCRSLFADAIECTNEAVQRNCLMIEERFSKQELFDLINGENLHQMCDYCDWPMKTVQPAVQMERKVESSITCGRPGDAPLRGN